MKTFKEYLKESQLSFEDALKVFGISSSTYRDLDKQKLRDLYKRLAIANHPDKGGSVREMQKINQAYDILQTNTGEISKADLSQLAKEKARLYAEISISAIKENLDVGKFKSYFEEIFKEPFTPNLDITDISTISQYSNYVSATVNFSNSDKTIVLEARYTITFSDLYGSENKLGSSTNDLSVYAYTDILYNRKKLVLVKSRYSYDRNYSIMKDPQKLFPKVKLLAQVKKNDSVVNKTLKKADALLILKHELGAEVDVNGGTQWASIVTVVPKGFLKWHIYRTTAFGSGAWYINQTVTIGKDGERQTRDSMRIKVGTILETQESFDYFVRFVKGLKGNVVTKADLENKLNDFILKYREKFFPNM